MRERIIALVLSCVCLILFNAGRASADTIILKGEHPALGGVKGKIISGAKPGKKPGEVERTGDSVEILISVNKDVVGTVWIAWDKIEQIIFSGDNESSYAVDEQLRKEQERARDRSQADYDQWLSEQKEKAKTEGAKEDGEGKETKDESDASFMPDEEKQVDIWIAQLGLGSQRHSGRRELAKVKLIELGKKVVTKIIESLNTNNKLLKRNAAAVLGRIGTDADAAIGPLIQAAKDDDEFVRFEVIDALRKITGEDFGYKWDSSVTEQRNAVNKWEKWWEEEKKKREEESSSDSGSKPESEEPEPDSSSSEPTITKPVNK